MFCSIPWGGHSTHTQGGHSAAEGLLRTPLKVAPVLSKDAQAYSTLGYSLP